MMSNSVPEREKETLTGCVSFYTQWIDICVCIRVRGLHLVSTSQRALGRRKVREVVRLGRSIWSFGGVEGFHRLTVWTKRTG